MPVKYFAPKVTVKLCIIDFFFLLEITVVNKMNNLNVCSAQRYLYPRSRFKLDRITIFVVILTSGAGTVYPSVAPEFIPDH